MLNVLNGELGSAMTVNIETIARLDLSDESHKEEFGAHMRGFITYADEAADRIDAVLDGREDVEQSTPAAVRLQLAKLRSYLFRLNAISELRNVTGHSDAQRVLNNTRTTVERIEGHAKAAVTKICAWYAT